MSIVEILLLIIILLMTVPSAFGFLMIYHVFVRRKHEPADKSNRVNHFRLVWFAMTREELFVKLFPWMKRDEYENISK